MDNPHKIISSLHKLFHWIHKMTTLISIKKSLAESIYIWYMKRKKYILLYGELSNYLDIKWRSFSIFFFLIFFHIKNVMNMDVIVIHVYFSFTLWGLTKSYLIVDKIKFLDGKYSTFIYNIKLKMISDSPRLFASLFSCWYFLFKASSSR